MNDYRKLKTLLEAARDIMVFTGAGISTESGIPDFRSPGGIWSKYRPIDFSEFMTSEEARRESWRRKFATDTVMLQAEPNAGHRAVARLVELGKCSAVVTQNVDGLHAKAGVPQARIVELHGNATYATCLDCGQRHELAAIREKFQRGEELPDCVQCGGIVKTATISFGQAMPVVAMARAQEAAERCDLCLVMGSSLVVYPAAAIPLLAKRRGAQLAIVNREATPQDDEADLVIHGEIGPTLAAAVGVN
ncbi:MAG: NAD-dependent deacetylase [Alphaproteobacteria bacterium]|nr:NAD-dependent deacetylase [Alphaproteobacteria bacterium]